MQRNLFRQLTIINKLSLLLVAAIVFMLLVVGFYFDYFLKENHLESTKKRMLHGFSRLAYNLRTIEKELKEGSIFVKSDESMLASIDLINNYQDKQHYNAILLDEEKKLIAHQLLHRVKLSFNNAISLYDKNKELIAWVTKEPEGYLLQFISYDVGGEARLFSRYEDEEEYRVSPFKSNLTMPFFHGDRYPQGEPRKDPLITYGVQEKKIFIKSHLSIFDSRGEESMAHIELFHILDESYFDTLSHDLDTVLYYTTDSQYGNFAIPLLNSSETAENLEIEQSEEGYLGVKSIETLSGPVYFIAKLDNLPLKEALNQNRYQFMGLLTIVAILILALTRYLFFRGLAIPFGTLMGQIDRIEQEDYAIADEVKTGDELEAISKNINRLARVVAERESSLRRSQRELMATKESLQESLIEFKHLFNSTMESIIISQNGRCIDINEEALRQFGYGSKEEAVGLDVLDFIAGDGSREIVAEQFKKDVTAPYEANAMTKGGSVFPALLNGYNFPTKRGIIRISAVIDLTEIKKSQAALEALNQNLQSEVARQIDEIRDKDEIMIQQSKHAAMGEMISNISHQWRQPLSALGLLVQDIDDAYEFGELDKDYIEKTTQEAMELINFMSQTIDDFRNFFAPTDKKSEFVVKAQIEAIMSLVSSRMANHRIALTIEGSDVSINGFPNKFKQVIINILNNANDAISARMAKKEISQGSVRITIADEGEKAVVQIEDNGGGIDPAILHKIFDPYFTTKFKSQGTGIGLYMSKTIVEKGMGGELNAENIEDGARFTITLPKSI